MFHCRTDMADEQAVQLQELNSRLSAYLSRVRQLEQENQLLVEEIESLQVDREVEWKRGYEVEITKLRTQLEEVTVEKSRAEMERESLWQEFQHLKVLCGEVQAIRANIEKELARHRVDLKKAEDGCRMLEEVLLRLQAEHQELVVVCEQEVANLRGGVLGLTVEWVREEIPYRGTSLSLREIEEYSIEVSETWKETFQQYQRKVEELEEWVRVSAQNLEGAEEEKRQHIQELGELRWQVEELERIRMSLEEELRAMRDKFMLEVHEYQAVIDTLEEEKESLALSISERLKDYHELMQTKTDLSVEVATYRALLEGEHNKGMFTWTEEQIRKMQQGSRPSAHEHIFNYSLQERENARRFVPAVHPIVDTRHKTLLLQGSSSVPRLRPGTLPTGSATTVRKDVLITEHRPAPSAREEVTYQSSTKNYNGRTLPWHTDNYRPSLPTGRASTITTRETTSNVQMPSQDIRGAPRPGISQVTKSTVENVIQPPSYDRSWEFRETKTTRNEVQGVSTEKTKVHEYPKPSSTNLPKAETKGVKVTNIEKTVSLGEKPSSREERSYVFEIQTKDTTVSERGNTRQDGLITVDVPVKVNANRKVQETHEMNNQTQKEMNFMMNRQAKEDGVTQEGLRTIEIPIQLTGTKETQEKTTVIDKTRGEKSFIVNEEVNKYLAAVSDSKEQTREWETRNDQTSSINQEISTEKTKAEELYKPLSENLPKEETQRIKVTTVEQTVSLGEKPSREETSYVFDIRPKDTTTSERVNTRHEESISIDVPIKVIGTGKVHEMIEREDPNQKEMNFMVQTRVKLEGEDVAQEGLGTIEIPIQLIGQRETQEKTIVIDKTRGESSFIVNDEVKQYSADVSESEERTRGWETQKDQTSSINQEISMEKIKLDELSEPSSQNIPKEGTKSFTVTTIEKTVALGEKPSREETNYVFEIRPKDMTVSERINTRNEESISVDVPIQIIGMGKVPEKNERENQNQKPMDYMVHTQVKLEGEDVAHEGLRTIEIPIQLMGTRGTQEKTIVIDTTRGERSFVVNEEVKQYPTDVSESEKQTSGWETRKGQTSWTNQEITHEKTKLDELSKPSSQNLPKEETQSIRVTTVEKTVSLGEKPSREETSYVFEIRPKDKTVSERVNTRCDESISINVPIQIIGKGKVQEKNEREGQTQNEMNFLVHTQVKLEGEDINQEGLKTIEIPIQLMGTTETQEKTAVIDKTQLGQSFIVNKEFKAYSADVSEGSVESEEQIKGWDSQKDQKSSVDQENPSDSLGKRDHTPVGFEIHGMERVSQDSNIALTARSVDRTQANKDASNVAETEELSTPETESHYNTVEDGSATLSSRSAASWAEEFAEHVKIADILREFGHSTGLEKADSTSHDAKVTYSKTKQSADNGTVTTEITMQSKTEEDFDLSDEEEIEQLLNSSLEKTTLKHLKGMQAESFLGNILHGGMKGKMGVRVEITEEPMELTLDEQGEFSVPFQVEEADDATSSFQRNYGASEEFAHCSMAAQGLEDQAKAREDTTHVEDVTDGGDTGEYLEYIVSTPDDFAMHSGEHDDSLYGHVHIEEESSIRYSWEDEFLKSSQQKKTSSDLPEDGSTTETYHGDREDPFNDSVEEKEAKASHVERLVIEKEIKVPLELQTSILGLLSKEIKDPKHQLRGALEQLEESLPGILKEELSALSTEDQQDSNDFSVDIKKFEQTNNDGVVTIVAEINVSKTIDVDNLDVLNNLEGNPGIIEEALLHSSKEDAPENLKSHKDIDIAGKPIEIEVSTAGNNSMLWSSKQLHSSSKIITNKELPSSTADEPAQERPDSDPSKPILTGETTQSQTSADVNKFVRHIKLDPKEMKTIEHVIFEGPVSESWELGSADKHSPTEGSTDVTRSVRHFKVGKTEIRTTQEFISEGPSSEFGEEVPQTEESMDGSRMIRHIKLGPREVYSSEQIIFEGPISELPPAEGGAANNQFIRHIQLGAKEFQTEQQIIFQGPICESPESNDKGDSSTTSNISTKHFKLTPTESQTMEHIIFHGPLSHSAGTETLSEGGSSTSIRHFSLGSKTQSAEQIIFEGPISEASAESSTHVRHIKISPTDGQIIFEGPISDSLKTDLTSSTRHIKIKTRDIEASEEGTIEHQGLEQHLPSVVEIPPSSDSVDANRPITLIKLGPTEKSFTFQVDVSQSSTEPSGEGGSQQTKMIFSSSTLAEDPNAAKTEAANEDKEKHVKEANGQSTSTDLKPDAYEEYFQSNGQEVIDTSMFDRTIQLQRMVDQRSLISDEKKIAVVYLDDEDDFF